MKGGDCEKESQKAKTVDDFCNKVFCWDWCNNDEKTWARLEAY